MECRLVERRERMDEGFFLLSSVRASDGLCKRYVLCNNKCFIPMRQIIFSLFIHFQGSFQCIPTLHQFLFKFKKMFAQKNIILFSKYLSFQATKLIECMRGSSFNNSEGRNRVEELHFLQYLNSIWPDLISRIGRFFFVRSNPIDISIAFNI